MMRRAALLFVALVGAAGLADADGWRVLSPESTGPYAYVADPTRTAVAALRAAGKLPLVEDREVTDERPALTNWADCAAAVAFDVPPRRHLLHSWRSFGVAVLKAVRDDREMSADRFRREAGFMAFQDGVEGVWLVPGERALSPSKRRALDEARTDIRLLLRLRELADKARAHADGNVRIEARRADYWIGWMPVEWELLDILRLETAGYVRRLEQLLGLPASDLPRVRSAPIEPQYEPAMPYAEGGALPVQHKLKELGRASLDLGDGLSFSADWRGFTLKWGVTNLAELANWKGPARALDFRLYIPGPKAGEWLPYRFHVDAEPRWTGPRAPAVGREGWLFSTDERFRPYSIAYGVRARWVTLWPRLRDFGTDYPDPQPSGGWSADAKKNVGTATISVSWLALFGHWPMQKQGRHDVWFVGLDKSPATGRPVAARILWPKGHPDSFWRFAGMLGTGGITEAYKQELSRVRDTWQTAGQEMGYPFVRTAEPAYCRYDTDTDTVFFNDLVRPMLDANEPAWQLVWTDKEHPNPKFKSEPQNVQRLILSNLGRLIHMSYATSALRLKYLEDRWKGELPPPYEPKAEEKTAEPDADYDPDALKLDDVEY